MKAEPFKVGDVLRNPKRFIVPIYQRTYSWKTSPHVETFVEQVIDKADLRLSGGESFPHYMGALLVIPRPHGFNTLETVDVVDGQQRLTTFQIFAAALRDLATAVGETGIADLLGAHVLNPDGPLLRDPKVERYKLHPTAYDRALFRDLIDLDLAGLRAKYSVHFYKKGTVHENAPLPLRAFLFVRQETAAFVEAPDRAERALRLTALAAALLEDFRVIVITLGEKDDAQVIFETLNSGGEPLAAMDLVRNDVFHRAALAGADVETLMETRWKTFEDEFWKKTAVRGRIQKPRIDFFLADMLAAEEGGEIKLTELYARYKLFARSAWEPSVDAELDVLLRHAPTYRALVERTGDGPFAQLAADLDVFDVGTAYPLVFVIAASAAEEQEKAHCYTLISSFIVRRALCGLTTKSYTNHFIRIAARLKEKGISRASLVEAFAESTGDAVRFPDNEELLRAILSRPQYGYIQQKRLRHIFAQLERASRDAGDETIGLRDDLTIEHVLPEVWRTSWPLPEESIASVGDALGDLGEARRMAIAERESLKHTLGNLTLLTPSKNPELGNGSFEAKKAWLRQSLLKLNQDIANRETWDETAIRERGAALHALAVRIWPAP